MDEIVSWLVRLIEFNTTARGGDARRCADFIGETLSRRGVTAETFTTAGAVREGCHLLATVPGESPDAVMLHAHLDTAEYGPRGEWMFPARRATLRGGNVCGRGALDCKGPLAVWMKLLADAAQAPTRPYTLKLLVSDLEEQGGEDGLGLLLARRPQLLEGVRLVIGEGGGFPFPFDGKTWYTFQTGEREPADEAPYADGNPDREQIGKILSMGVEKGYYSRDILTYAAQEAAIRGRKLDIRPLYQGMEPFFRTAPVSRVYARYGPLFEEALRGEIPGARLMPCITPGASDNRRFREAGIPVAGFFPLDGKNSLRGIHGSNEYISQASLALAYRTVSAVVKLIRL